MGDKKIGLAFALRRLPLFAALPLILLACVNQSANLVDEGTKTPVATSRSSTPSITVMTIPAASVTATAIADASSTCALGSPPTPSQTEGPYYKVNPPERTSFLEAGVEGTRLTVTGHVFTSDCKPVQGARVDFWQADAQGRYDNSGYRFRGFQLTDASGRYSLETVLPGLYPGRTRHIHVKVVPRNQAGLTTQLYFPDEPQNASDRIFDSRLVMRVADEPAGMSATFDFILPFNAR